MIVLLSRRFEIANALFRPLKCTPKRAYIHNKMAQIGHNRPKFRVHCAKKYFTVGTGGSD